MLYRGWRVIWGGSNDHWRDNSRSFRRLQTMFRRRGWQVDYPSSQIVNWTPKQQVFLGNTKRGGHERPAMLQPNREKTPGKRHRLRAEALPQSYPRRNRFEGKCRMSEHKHTLSMVHQGTWVPMALRSSEEGRILSWLWSCASQVSFSLFLF